MDTPGKGGGKKARKKAGKKPIQVKTCFTSPFELNWSPIPNEDRIFILKKLTDKFMSIGLEKKEGKAFWAWRKERGPDSLSMDTGTKKVKDSPKGCWTDVALRRQLALGINEVTKALERNQLKLVLVCKSAKPQYMTQHLIALSASRSVPAGQVPHLSATVAKMLGLSSILALGFRNSGCQGNGNSEVDVFADTVEAIIPRVPGLDVAWLQGGASDNDKQLDVDFKKGAGGQKVGQKRKLEPNDTVTKRSKMNPLKVKRIVANPDKTKRKRNETK